MKEGRGVADVICRRVLLCCRGVPGGSVGCGSRNKQHADCVVGGDADYGGDATGSRQRWSQIDEQRSE